MLLYTPGLILSSEESFHVGLSPSLVFLQNEVTDLTGEHFQLVSLRKCRVQVCSACISQPWQKAAFFSLFPTA